VITGFRSIQRAAKADAGVILPEIPELDTLYRSEFRVKFRRGQTTMITGESGTQKSGFMLWLCRKWNVPTIYFSADLEEHTAMTRLAASITGDSTETVAYNIRHGGSHAYAEALEESNIWFCYDPNPSLDTVYGEIAAFVELYDMYPAVVVIDNMMDMILDGAENEFSAMKQMILELKSLARDTSASVFILHHMLTDTRPLKGEDPEAPGGVGRISGKVSQTAGLILSVALTAGNIFRIAVIKNRTGKGDKSGRTYLQYRADPSTNRFFAYRHTD
jgi:hypothetical protein